MAIAAVLLAVGVPNFRSLIASNRLTSTTNELVASLAQARSEAIRRGARVTVCMSANGAACATTGNWAQGWISFVDTTRSDPTAALDTGEAIVFVAQRNPDSTVIRGNTSAAQFISFSSDGTARTMGGLGGGGTLRVCEPSSALTNANRARNIEITPVGRLSTTTPANVASTCPAP